MTADDPPFYQNVKYKACSELACHIIMAQIF